MSMRHAAGAIALGLITLCAGSAAAQTPMQLTPPAPRAAPEPAAKPAPVKPKTAAPAPTAPAPTASHGNIDPAYGAYQRGYYMTAFAIATRRVEEAGDVKAMTLLGELYANGWGVERDDTKAAEWYRLAADRGDRQAMFALAMFHLGGRGGAANREQAAKLLASAAKLGHAPAAYDLGLLYLEGQMFPQ